MPIFGSATIPIATNISDGVFEYSCAAGAAVNDAVEFSLVADDTVVVLASNVMNSLCIGFITEKLTATTCKVKVLGPLSGFTGLTKGVIVFLGVTGAPTHVPPTTGEQQVLGVASSATTIFVKPDMQKVKRS